MRIHLLCDHKWRDLPNLTAIKLRLEQLGHRVLLSSTKDALPMAQAFRPDCIVLNHLFSDGNRKMAAIMREAGVAVVVLPTEGAVRPEFQSLSDGEFSDYRLADLHLAWSEASALGTRQRWGFGEDAVPVAGCSRLDFYDRRFAAAVDTREEFCRQYNLDPDRPIVTWATQYGYAHLAGDTSSPRFLQWLREVKDVGVKICYERIGIDVARVPSIHAQGRAVAGEAFFTLAAAIPDVQFLIKPHPIEDLSFYRKQIAERAIRNVRFCPTNYIWNVLNATDIELHRHCTTAVEAWMWKKPTIEMAMDHVPEIRWDDREAGSDIAQTAEELIAIVRRYLDGAQAGPEQQAYRQDYIHKWFGAADGRRCVTAGDLIDGFLKARGSRRGYFHPIPGLRATIKDAVGTALRYRLGYLPDEPLLRPRRGTVSEISMDKLIARPDVLAYQQRIASAVG